MIITSVIEQIVVSVGAVIVLVSLMSRILRK